MSGTITRSANAVLKLLLYLIRVRYQTFLPEMAALWEAVEARLEGMATDRTPRGPDQLW